MESLTGHSSRRSRQTRMYSALRYHGIAALCGTSIQIPDGIWCNVLTDERFDAGPVRVADLLRRFPDALLAIRRRNAYH